MAFEARLFSRTRFKKYRHCLKLIEANARFAPLWERLCLAIYVSAGPPLAKLFKVDTSENWARADRIIGDVFAVTGLAPEEVARLLREYVRLRTEKEDHLPFDEARDHIYDRSFYPIVTHFTYALQPSATARLNFVREVVRSMSVERASVADLGCGSGVILSEILLMRPSWTGRGLDISRSAVEYASRLARHKGVSDRAQFRAGDIARLPYEDESLDLVVASEIIEHMPQPEKVVDEIARVLKHGGRLILTMPVESHTPGHIHSLSGGEDLRELCEGAGLKVRRLEPRWHFGFGDDRRHVFALAEADGRPFKDDYVSPDVLKNFTTSYPEPEAV